MLGKHLRILVPSPRTCAARISIAEFSRGAPNYRALMLDRNLLQQEPSLASQYGYRFGIRATT
jgi:hypothetical protein